MSPKKSSGFTAEERAAMKERARELKADKSRAAGEADVLAKIAESAPELVPRTWYGMPAYTRDGKVVCFFQNAGKFKSRYSTLGFNDTAKLDNGDMWPTSFALQKLTAAEEKKIRAIV